MQKFKEIVEKFDYSKVEMNNYKDEGRSEENHVALSNHYSHHSLSEDEKRALIGYASDSERLNTFHWNKHHNIQRSIPFSDNDKENMTKQTTHLDSAINKFKTPHSMTVFSGTANDPRRRMDKDNIIHHPAYLSTSRSFGVASKFSRWKADEPTTRHILKIHVPKDHPGVYVSSDKMNGLGIKHERELVLPRGMNLRYKHTTEFKHEASPESFGQNINYHVHHMEIVK